MKAWEELGSAVERVFGAWPAYRYSVSAGLGGAETAAKDRWFQAELVQFFRANKDLEAEEVAHWLSSVLFAEFDSVYEDGSVDWVAGLLCQAFELLRDGRAVELEPRVFAHLPSHAQVSQAAAASRLQDQDPDEDDDEDDDDEGPSGESTAASAAPSAAAGQAPAPSRPSPSAQEAGEDSGVQEDMEVEEGWTPVRRKHR